MKVLLLLGVHLSLYKRKLGRKNEINIIEEILLLRDFQPSYEIHFLMPSFLALVTIEKIKETVSNVIR